MGTFTSLADADVAAIAAGFGLGAVRHWRAIAAGTINSNFALTCEGGSFFLRINEGKAVGDVAWEGELVAALAARGVPAPVPMAGPDGARYLRHRGHLVSAFAWQPGCHRTPAEVTAADAAAVGAVLARIHLAGLELPAAMRRPSIYDHAHLRGRFDSFRDHPDPALAEAIAVLGAELAWLDDHEPIRAAATFGLIHGDLFRDNVLFAADPPSGHVGTTEAAGAARLVGVLDFEQASGGSLAYDLAVCVNDWAWAGGPRPEMVRALIAGYERVRPLPPSDRAGLDVEVRAAAVRFTITRITDVHLPGISNDDKDFRDFLARVRHWRRSRVSDLFDPV